MALRGTTIPVRNWWLRLARGLITHDDRGQVELGKVLAKHIKREKPFSHTMLSRFAAGHEGITAELAQAMCAEFKRLPIPVFYPRSYEEAAALAATADRYDNIVGADDDDDANAKIDAKLVEAPIVEMKPKKKLARGTARKRAVVHRTGS
jgi:hypothetical protein